MWGVCVVLVIVVLSRNNSSDEQSPTIATSSQSASPSGSPSSSPSANPSTNPSASTRTGIHDDQMTIKQYPNNDKISRFTSAKPYKIVSILTDNEYDTDYVIAIISPTSKDAVIKAVHSILEDKNLKLKNQGLIMSFYTDERAALIDENMTPTTSREDNDYLFNHLYAEYATGPESVGPHIFFYELNSGGMLDPNNTVYLK